MGGMTTADMAELAALNELFMPSVASISHTIPGTVTPGGDGSETTGDVTTVTSTPCRFVDGMQAAEQLVAMRLTVEANAVLYIPLSVAATEADTVAIGGVVYQIVGTSAGASYGTALVLALKLME
jgi:SPP1 family predicted phage head-tail adaptor